MYLYLKTILLGIIEGLTEFLPVSSTGHLIIFSEYFKFFENNKAFSDLFNVVIQIGAIFAVLIYFRKKIFPKNFSKNALKDFFSLWIKVAIAVLPSGVIGILYHKKIETLLFTSKIVAISLIIGAIWILLIDGKYRFKFIDKLLKKNKYNKIKTIDNLSLTQSLKIGIFQCFALIPGMSRSAMTIIGALICGTNRSFAAEFSFYMSIPTILGAGLVDILKTDVILNILEIKILILGTFISFIVSFIVISMFMNYIKKHHFTIFAYYRIILGILILILIK